MEELTAQDVALGGPDGVLAQVAELLGPDDAPEVGADLPAVHAYPVVVRQLLGNLIDNAVKYARPGRPATVRVSAQRQGARVIVEIQDDGVGVEDSERSPATAGSGTVFRLDLPAAASSEARR